MVRSGTTTILATTADVETAAAQLLVPPVNIRVVGKIETPDGPFLEDGRLRTLFEPARFSKLTGGRYDSTNPNLSQPGWSPGYAYGSYADQWDKISAASELDPVAALEACSWGRFQVLGSNYRAAGYTSAKQMVDAYGASELEHLLSFVRVVQAWRAADELAAGSGTTNSWRPWARIWNGPGYAAHDYHGRCAKAWAKMVPLSAVRQTVRMGDTGPAVKALQKLLGIDEDGDFGPVTRTALRAAQERCGLTVDGICGPRTWRALESLAR